MNRRKINELIAAWGIAFVMSTAAACLGIYLSKYFPTFNALPLFFILLGAFVLACIVNRMTAKAFARKHFGMPSAERRELMKRHIEACKKDPAAVLAQYNGMEFAPICLFIIYFLFVISITVSGAFCLFVKPPFLGFSVALSSWFMGWFLLYMPLYRLFEQIPSRLKKGTQVPFPHLEAIIHKAADKIGIRGKFPIRFSQRYLSRVIPHGKTYEIRISPHFLATLTEEEVYQIFLCHFDHFSHLSTYRSHSLAWKLTNIGSAYIRRETFAFDLFYSHIDATLEWDMEFSVIAYRYLREEQGLRRIQESGNPQAAISMLCKQAMWRYFSFEFNDFVKDPFYMEPTPHDHHERDVCEAFRNALRQRYDVWLDMLMREIQSESYSPGPLFREYLQFLTPQTLPTLLLSTLDSTNAFDKEILEIIEWYDKQKYLEFYSLYKFNRQREYLEPLHITEAYEADPTGYTTPELSPVINAYRDICEYGKAEALCDRIIETETNQFALAHAIYFKGMCMLHRYETEGIDLIYRAIDLNKNYMKDGFEMVAEYCTLCGLEDEYEAFLRRAEIQVSAHAYNHEGAGSLSASDRLEPETALGDMLPDILAYMEKVSEGCIREIYLVRKVISEDFFTSAFVIMFEYGASEDVVRRAYEAIFNYLDAYPVDWQFSLFVYDRETEAAVKRVANSRVWQKGNLTK